MNYKEAQFTVQWLRGNGIPVYGAWWAKGATTGVLTQAIKDYPTTIGAPVTGTINTATRNQINYGLSMLGGKNPSGIDPATRKIVTDTYGPGLASYLGHWELGPILVNAAKNGWDQAHLNAAIQKTYWWHNTQASQREWDKLAVEDPGEMRQQLQRQSFKIKSMSQQLGLGLSDSQVFAIAHDSLRFAWDDSQTQKIMADHFSKDPRSPGQLQEIAQRVRAGAAEYFIVYTPKQAHDIALRVVAGTLREESLSASWAHQATARFPSLATQIAQGMKPKDYFVSHQQAIAQTLEMAPEQIDLVNDKRWAPVLESVDQSGKRRPMTVGEAEQWARGTTMYQTTRAANQDSNAAVRALGEAFGKIKM